MSHPIFFLLVSRTWCIIPEKVPFLTIMYWAQLFKINDVVS